MIDEVTHSRRVDPLTVLVVIVSYQHPETTIQCLRSLVGEMEAVPGARVVVCDNGSGDGTAEALRAAIDRENWGAWVHLDARRENLGFTGGNNIVLRGALRWAAPPRWFLLLNPDTIVRPGALTSLLAAGDADASAGIVGPRLLSADGAVQHSCFRDHSVLGEFLRAADTGLLNRVLGRSAFCLEPPRERNHHDWVSFACALIRREVFEQAGLLDEGFFMYFDDPDYCRRARRLGWHITHCPEAEVVHLEGGSSDVPAAQKANRRRAKYYYASRSRYFAKHTGRIGLWAANLAWSAGRLASVTRELLGDRRKHVCEMEARDVWTNWVDPIGLSEPGRSRTAGADGREGTRR